MRDSSVEAETGSTSHEEAEPSMMTIALGKDSGSFFLTRFDVTTDARWDGGADEQGENLESRYAASEEIEKIIALRSGFDENLGLPLAHPKSVIRQRGIRHIVGVVTTALVIASAGFVLGAGIVDRSDDMYRGQHEIAQLAEPIEVQGPDASPPGESTGAGETHGLDAPELERSPQGQTPSEARTAIQPAPIAEPEAVTVEEPMPIAAAESLEEVHEEGSSQGELSELLRGALETTEEGEAHVAQRPQSLTRQQVISGMRAVTWRVMNCTSTERVIVDVTISGETGEVRRARVNGSLAGTAEGACIERSLRLASFPLFDNEQLNVRSYPFVLR